MRPINKCPECGETFRRDTQVTEPTTKHGFLEHRTTLEKDNNDKQWDEIYEQFSSDWYPAFGGPFTDSPSFIDWLKTHYIAPNKILKKIDK